MLFLNFILVQIQQTAAGAAYRQQDNFSPPHSSMNTDGGQVLYQVQPGTAAHQQVNAPIVGNPGIVSINFLPCISAKDVKHVFSIVCFCVLVAFHLYL